MSPPDVPLSGVMANRRTLHHRPMRLEITDDLIDALIDAHDDTLVALRAALLRELAQDEHMHAREVMLCGIPVPDRHVLELAGKLRDSGFDATAARLEDAYTRQTWVLALSIAERDEILQVLVDCPDSLAELRAVLVLVQECEWRRREGL
jgi:hypothetical protein